MSKSIESLCSSTIKYTTSNNIVQQIQQGQLPEDQSEPHSTNINNIRPPEILSPSKINPVKLSNSDEESGQIIFQTVLQKNIRDYEISPEKKKKKIHKQQIKQKNNKQKDKTSSQKINHEKEKKNDKKNLPEENDLNTHKNIPFQPNSYFNPYMYPSQVPIPHIPPGVMPQPYPIQYMHHNQQFGYPNQMAMVSMVHPPPMPMPINHNPYIIPGPMMQIPGHLPPIPINHYKQTTQISNQHKEFSNQKNENLKNTNIKQIYPNQNHYQNDPPHQNNQNNQNNHNYNNYNYNQNSKYPNQNTNYTSNNYHSTTYPNNNYSIQNNYQNNNGNQSYQRIGSDYSSNNTNFNNYQQNNNNYGNNYNNQQNNSIRQGTQPYQSQRDRKKNRFQQLKGQIRQQLKQYQIQEKQQLLQALKCLVKYSYLNTYMPSTNTNQTLSQSLAQSCYEKNIAKIEKICEMSNSKGQSLQKILNALELSDLMIKIKERKLQRIILNQKDLQKTKFLIQKLAKDPRRMHK